MPSLTPQTRAPRCSTAASVCAAPGPAPSAASATSGNDARENRLENRPMENGHLRSRYISGFWRTTTLVPTGTRSNRSITSGLTSRKHPDDTDWPMVWGWLVPWIR